MIIFYNQFSFILGHSTTKAIHLVRILVEQYQERKKDLYMLFINLEKAHDKVPTQILQKYLEVRGIPIAYTRFIHDMHDRATTCVRIVEGDLKHFLYKGSNLRMFLFTLLIDVLTWHVQEKVLWCMLFVNGVVLSNDSQE